MKNGPHIKKLIVLNNIKKAIIKDLKDFFLRNRGKAFACILAISLLAAIISPIINISGKTNSGHTEPELYKLDIPNHDFNVGLKYWDQGDYSKANEYLEKALDEEIKINGTSTNDCIKISFNIAYLNYEMLNYDKSIEYYNNALVSAENKDANIYIAHILSGLAITYHSMNKNELSLDYHKKSLQLYIQTHGDNHVHTATEYDNYALALCSAGDYISALVYQQKALKIYKNNKTDAYDLALLYDNTATTYDLLGNLELTLKNRAEAVRLLENTRGTYDYDTAIAYSNYAKSLLENKQFEQANKYAKAALNFFTKKLGDNHPYTIHTEELISNISESIAAYKESNK